MPTDPPDPDDLDGLIERIADGKPVGALSPGAGVAARRAHALAALLDGVAHAARAEVAPPPRPSPRSAMLGPFRLLEMIGEGGMGEVWMAERCDGQVEQRVAIKRVRGAARLSMLRHLLRERRILARLNHPNIAHFLGADVDGEGEPYLVLEFVEGIPLDRWCREHQPTLEQRLCMFLAICGAVEHAHRHLVVHRDLKPANVLVTADGTPKLLDFGIARLLEDSTSGQTTGPPAMTPRYAAPEQFSGDDVTAAVDQYALGLLLHELLTGGLPQARSDGNLAKIAAAFGDGDPPAASSTMSAQGNGPVSVAMVRGDLDAIIARCLRADPLTRYASVGALAADLRLHLEGRPVAARGDARGYRLRRFAARHRLAIAMACMALAAILAALFGALFQADRAMREAAAAAAAGRYADALVPVEVPGRRGETTVVDTDEHIRPDASLEALAKLRPIMGRTDPAATVTAGNASGQNDAAAACIVTTRSEAERRGLQPLLELKSWAVSGVAPEIMGIGPVPASAAALAKAGITLADLDVIELNEAFAAQALAVLREWGISADDERLNPNGSGISLGHPVGATGARILATMAYEMRRREGRYALETMCIGGGQGLAAVFERVN